MATANHFWMDAALGAVVRRIGLGRLLCLRARPPGRLGLAHGQGLGVSDGLDQRTRRARGNGRGALTAAEMRAVARNRLIESRLTPNAISLTGFVGNLIAAALILNHHFVLAGIAFILGSLCDMFDSRYSRMSGKGTPFGAFLDSTLDRIEEGVVLAAVAWWFAEQGDEVAVGRLVLAVVGAPWSLHARAQRRSAWSARSGCVPSRPGSDPLGGPGVRGRGADPASTCWSRRSTAWPR